MPTAGDDADYAERAAAHAETNKNAWRRTIEDMRAREEELLDAGWDVVAVAAGDTAPESPDAGNADRFGLTHVIPDNYAEPFRRAFERGEFPTYRVYRNDVEGRVFLVTELLDPQTSTAILIAGTFELRHAPPMVRAALDAGKLYTHVQTLDRTYLGSFRHEDVERFFPDADRVLDYVRDA